MANGRVSRKQGRQTGLYALGCLLLVGSLLAVSVLVAKLADGAGVPRLTFLMAAMAGAGMVLGTGAAARQEPMPLTRRTMEYALVSGLLLALPNALAFLAVPHVGVGFVSLGLAFPILITWTLSVLLGLERLQAPRLLGVLMGLSGGLVLAVAKGGGDGGAGEWAWLMLLMPLMLAVGNIYRTQRWPSGTEPIFLAALMMVGGALTLLPLALAFESGEAGGLFDSAAKIRLLLLEVGVFSLLYLFFFVLQRLAGPVYLSQIGTVAAVIGTLLAVLALGEPPTPNLGFAAALLISGAAIFHFGQRRTSARAVPLKQAGRPNRWRSTPNS